MGNVAETFYNIHTAITIAKNGIGIDKIKSEMIDYMVEKGYSIESDNGNSIVIKVPENEKRDIFYDCTIFMQLCLEKNAYSYFSELRANGYPEGYVDIILCNVIHSYFIIPMTPYGIYEIRI